LPCCLRKTTFTAPNPNAWPQPRAKRRCAVCAKKIPSYRGALDVVERLAAKFPVALASSGSRESVDAFLELNCARPLLQTVLSGGDIKAAKPAPDIYLEAARRLEIFPRDCLVVEDSIPGAQSAAAAGA
jgi:HAD superfamily hydrolase (TIGR01509 family)